MDNENDVSKNVVRYAVEQFPQWEKAIGEESPSTAATGTDGLIDGDIKVVARRCTFIQHCCVNATNLSEPKWYAGITNMSLVRGSDKSIHEMSSPYHAYDPNETQEKINHAREEKKPCTCGFIQKDLGFTDCPPGGCPVEAPIGWLSRRGQAYDTVLTMLEREQPERKDAWADPIQDALAEVKQGSEADYRYFLQKIRDRVPNFGINDFKASINDRVRKKIQQRQESNNQALTLLSAQLGYDAKLPEGYYFDSENQLIYQSFTKVELVVMQPLGIASRYIGDSGETLDSIVFQTNGQGNRWRQVLVKPQLLASIQRILELSNYGVLVDTTNSISLVRFLTKFKKVNGETMGTIPYTSHLGWQDDDSFFPGISGYRFIRQGGVVDETESYGPKGTLEEWVRLAEPARRSAGARLALTASFAAPLLKLADCRTFIVHLWGPSRGGKTAAQVLAASVWLNPKKAMISFNSTKVGLEKQLSHFANLPVIIDERQVVGDNQKLLDTLIYMISEEQGRTRGTKTGTVQLGERWNTVVITSGEHPLSAQSSAGGAKTRSLEPFFERVVDDQEYAARLHIECRKLFGVAGHVFLQTILENESLMREALVHWSEYIKDVFKEVNAAHRSYLTVIAATDYLVSAIIWNRTEADAEAETKEFIALWKKALDVTGETEEIHRVRVFVEGWLTQYERHFSGVTDFDPGVPGDRFGWYLADGNIGIVPTIFSKALGANGFHWDRVKIDFAKQGWLKTGTDRGHISYTTTRTIPGQGSVRLVELIGFRNQEEPIPTIHLPEEEEMRLEEDGTLLI